MDIVSLNRDSDPETWSRIRKILLTLDIGGMSSDESEDEKPRPRRYDRDVKKVRRVAIEWLNPEISDLWAVVETYDNIPFDAILQRRGNASLSRAHPARRTNKTRAPIVGLPRNWYNNDWYCNLQSYQQKRLHSQADEPIPGLVCDLLPRCIPC
jgi:hypothetical protein